MKIVLKFVIEKEKVRHKPRAPIMPTKRIVDKRKKRPKHKKRDKDETT